MAPPFGYLLHSSSSTRPTHFLLIYYFSSNHTCHLIHPLLVCVSFKMIRTTVSCLLVAVALNILPLSTGLFVPKSQNYEFHFQDSEAEKCYFSMSDTDKNRAQYGQCMSMNGPDGCCLDGHYKPGICSNLGHICCIKPDPDCTGMRNNKAIAKLNIQQQKHFFLKLNLGDEGRESSEGSSIDTSDSDSLQFRPARSSNRRLRKVKTNFEVVEMPAHMQLDPVGYVNDALARYDRDPDEVANHLCSMLDHKYREASPWACIVGNDFGYSVDPAPGKYMLFYIGTVNRLRVMAFVSRSN